jgi:general secretion pathway protein A
LLQIILVGQPELDDKLDSVELRQLKQRIAVRTHLGPLDADETKRYIERRLEIAGAGSNSSRLFSQQAIATVYRYSQGLPRVINTICENALVAAYARQVPQVETEIIEYVAKEFRLNVMCSPLSQKSENYDERAIEQAINVLRNLDARRRQPIESEP